MGGVHLAIYELHAIIHQVVYGMDQCSLTGIALPGKHTFSKKYFAEPHAIKPSCQFAVCPGLGTERMPLLVQAIICIDDLFTDPGAIVAAAGGSCTSAYHTFKCGIDAILKCSFL